MGGIFSVRPGIRFFFKAPTYLVGAIQACKCLGQLRADVHDLGRPRDHEARNMLY